MWELDIQQPASNVPKTILTSGENGQDINISAIVIPVCFDPVLNQFL